MIRTFLLAAAGLMLLTQIAFGQNSGDLSADEIYRKSQLAYFYPGDDMKARLSMNLVGKGGGIQVRELTMLRIDGAEGGDQKYFIYFHEPGDVRRMTFMVWKYSKTEDDRWIFVPAVDLIRRLAADDKYSSFVGSDFSYEDVSGRDVSEDTHKLIGTEEYDKKVCYVLENTPIGSAPYAKRKSWIDTEDFIPVREEYYDVQGDLYKVFTVANIQNISVDGKSYPTPMTRTMDNVKTGHSTVVTFESVEYNAGLADIDFSERYMRQPPRDWIE